LPELETSQNLSFDIHASVVFELGESLITDVVQALVELVKNSYDADADYANVTISTAKAPTGHITAFPEAKGFIQIDDNGDGMTFDVIRAGWLTISNSLKRSMKRAGVTTKKGRTPLGDKGLGRLGTQRLGYNLEIFTRPEGAGIEHHVFFSWKSFQGQQSLSSVTIHRDTYSTDKKKGTTLIISDLRDISMWRGDAVDQVQKSLSAMISPYKAVRDFVVAATIDGREIELTEISTKIRDTAQLKYTFKFDGEMFDVQGRAKLIFFKPDVEDESEAFRRLVEEDGGKRFFTYLSARRAAQRFALKRWSSDRWFVQYQMQRDLASFAGLELDNGQIANPGPFNGEVDAFDFGRTTEDHQSVFDRFSEYKKTVRSLSGIRVFRDGFGVRVAQDWLGLGAQWTSAKSYYVLRPTNTLGYVAITAKANASLEETTDREGFKSTPHYHNFYEMLSQFVAFTRDAQSFLRRGWNDFRKECSAEVAQISVSDTPEHLSRRISEALTGAASLRDPLGTAAIGLRSASESSREALRIAARKPRLAEEYADLKPLLETIRDNTAAALTATSDVLNYLSGLTLMEGKSNVLADQIDTLREQLSQAYETVSLGLTAEALSHEIHVIADQLAERTQQLKQHLRRQGNQDGRIASYIEYIGASVSGLRKQLSHLAPSLRYVREKRGIVDMALLASETVEFYQERFAANSIAMAFKTKGSEPFHLYMNKGKLVQVLDNLILNSEYWLKEDLRLRTISKGLITFELQKPFVRISDNGRGIEPRLEASIFEPFVTGKGKGKGRGLGLFIVKQLLESEACDIALMPKRNKAGRLSVFEMNFSGVLNG
jgi:signal transduction histidine kinase